MPQLDMSLEELREYRGSSPVPADIDAFWDNALKELAGVDPCVEIKPADFRSPVADCYDLYFTGVGGARVYAKLLKPKNITGRAPALLQFHGYSMNSGDWFEKLPYAAGGFVVAALDCRGQGGKSRDTGGAGFNTLGGHIIRGVDDGKENLLFKKIFLDTAQLARIIMKMEDVDPDRVGCTGMSQGGGLTLACASLVPEIRLAAPVYPFLSDYRRVWNLDLGREAYQEIRDYFRHFDPSHKHADRFFETLAYIDIQNLVHRINAEVLMFTGLMDDVCPPSTQFAAYNRIRSKKNMVLYPDFSHENLPDQADLTYRFLIKGLMP